MKTQCAACMYRERGDEEMYVPLSGVANDRPQGPHGSVFIDLSHQDPSRAELSYIFSLTPTYPPVLSLPHPPLTKPNYRCLNLKHHLIN